MDSNIKILIKPLLGTRCCYVRVGNFKSLAVGFGKEMPDAKNLSHKAYCEWEIRTYSYAWRVIEKGNVSCGSGDSADCEEFNAILKRINFGNIISLEEFSSFDLRAQFDTGVAIDFLGTTRDQNEGVTLFCPGNQCVEFVAGSRWQVGPSNEPWPERENLK